MLAHGYLSATRATAEKGVRSRNRPAHRADRARAATAAQHPHPHSATRPRRRRRLVLVAPTTPGPGPPRSLPSPRTGTAITAVAVLGRPPVGQRMRGDLGLVSQR